MKSFLVILSSFFFFQANADAVEKACWNESRACSLAGSLELHTYPGGRTNKKGEDILETNLYLKLDPPVTVNFKDFDNAAHTAELVSLMEIAGDFDNHLFKIAKRKNHATVKTQIFEQQTGHHHTHFLIDANNNIVVDKK